jgi:hypothetical protein
MRHGRTRRNAPTEALTSAMRVAGSATRPPGARHRMADTPPATPPSPALQERLPRSSRGRSRGVATTPSTTAGGASDPAGPPNGSRQHGRRGVHQARPRVRTAAPDGPTAADDRHHQQPCPDEHPDNADPAVHDGRVPGRGCAQTVAGNRIVRGDRRPAVPARRQRGPSGIGQVARDQRSDSERVSPRWARGRSRGSRTRAPPR